MAAAQATGQKAPTVSAQSLPLNAFHNYILSPILFITVLCLQ